MALLAVLFAATAPGQEIEIRELAPDRFELTLLVETPVTEPAAQGMLRPKAVEVCGGVEPRFGRYRFESQVPLDRGGDIDSEARSSFKFVQEVSCGVTTSASGTEGSIGVRRSGPDRNLEAFVRRISTEHLAARSQGNFAEAYAALSEYLRVPSLADWSGRVRQFNEESGRLRSTVIWRVTVYDNPPGAPQPGVYIAVDFESEYERIPLQCGYLVWLQLPGERFVITREETGKIPADMFEPSRAEQLLQIKRQFGCAP